MTLFGWLRKINGTLARSGNPERSNTSAQRRAAARPCLEQLEDRVTPTTFDTITNAAISIAPNMTTKTATETVTATVTQSGITPVTPVTSGSVTFNLNGQTGTGTLNSSGQATFTTTLPLYAVATNQTLAAVYTGASSDSDTFNSSIFLSPVYLNTLNGLFSSNITFTGPALNQTSLPITDLGTYKGESNDVTVAFIAIDFSYVDPGTIQDFTLLGFTLAGSLAPKLGALFTNLATSEGIPQL